MKKAILLLIILAAGALALSLYFQKTSIEDKTTSANSLDEETISEETINDEKSDEERAIYIKISAEEAKLIMEKEENYIILDVRTEAEFNEGHIEGAILLPVDQIKKDAENVLPDKEKLILIYCRSGNRSKTAADQLIDMGYKNVMDFGGIIDWPYAVVK